MVEIVKMGSLPHLNSSHLDLPLYLHCGLRRHPDPLTLQHNNKKLAYSSGFCQTDMVEFLINQRSVNNKTRLHLVSFVNSL